MIRVRYSETVANDVDAKAALVQPMAFAQATAEHIYRRVALQGRTATPPASYDSTRNFTTTEQYAAKAGATGTRFASSAAFHAAAGKPLGRFHTTGGMWSGLQVRNYGTQGAIIDFTGSTLGAKSQKTGRNGKRKANVPVKVANRAKAWTVFRSSNVGVLENTPDELTSYADAMAHLCATYLRGVFGTSGVEEPRGNRSLYNAIIRLARGV